MSRLRLNFMQSAPQDQQQTSRKIPVNYSEWCDLFDEITRSARDDEFVDVVSKGAISWSSGVAERFIKTAGDMIRTRVNAAQDVYQRQLTNARGVTANISNAFVTLKKEYCYVYKLAAALPIPEEYRSQMMQMVQDQADQTQKSLEDSAKADRTGHLTSLVRNAHINRLV